VCVRGLWFVIFFFQAEDGIRDDLVTGVQTCALPIYERPRVGPAIVAVLDARRSLQVLRQLRVQLVAARRCFALNIAHHSAQISRSEERRVGKECRSRWWMEREQKNDRGAQQVER